MPSKDNLFGMSGSDQGLNSSDQGLSGSQDGPGIGAYSNDSLPHEDTSGLVETSANVDIQMNEDIEEEVVEVARKPSTDDSQSNDSRSVPEIDDHSGESEDPDDLEDAISLVLLEEVHQIGSNATSLESEISVGKVEALRKFSSMYRTEGMEVLKLNRRNKWQTRYLTVSSEMIQLQRVGDMSQHPRALLWLKRFNASQSYSFDATSSKGHGGVDFENIEGAEFGSSENQPPPKSNSKFKNSVQVNLHYNCEGDASRMVALRFKTQADADYFVSSMETIVDMLDHEGIY